MHKIEFDSNMNKLPDEIVSKIIFFLSAKEKVMLREVCKFLKTQVKEKYLYAFSLLCKLEFNIITSKNLVLKLQKTSSYITPIKRGVYRQLNEEIHHIHKYFKICKIVEKDKCIVDGCNMKRLGKLFIDLNGNKHLCLEGLFREHNTPYCSICLID